MKFFWTHTKHTSVGSYISITLQEGSNIEVGMKDHIIHTRYIKIEAVC